jgi:hypothetical protein
MKLDGAFIALKADPSQKAIFWKKVDGVTDLKSLKNGRRIKIYQNKGSRTCSPVSIRKILRDMNIDEKHITFSQLPVKKYDSSFLSDSLEYVQLKNS